MQVTVHLAPHVARELKVGSPASAAAREVIAVAKEMGLELRPIHPGSTDPDLASTFVAEATDAEVARQVVLRLQALEAIESAYVKPPPAMP